MDAFFIKINGALYPASDHDRELLKHIRQGESARLTFKRVRNIDFHRKGMALFRLAFDYWEPPEGTFRGFTPEKNFDEFRHNIIIGAGFYTVVYDVKGGIHFRAKSTAFQNMDDIEFEEVFTKSIDYIIKNVAGMGHYTAAELRSIVDQVEAFE